jgi:NAD(P)-dependent dehydrogenase (short-subunit alcohol dehydrogenase family)
MGKLRSKTALVTGAGRGIGRAIAESFAAEGANVAVTARTAAELDDLVAQVSGAGGQARAFQADLADRRSIPKLLAEVTAAMGPIDILVNNAGIGSSSNPKPVVDFDDDFWDLSMAINLNAPYLLTKAVLPDMIGRGWGRIITIASINSRVHSFHGAAYAASKHAVLGFMRTVAAETAAQGITANCICPGPVKTLMNEKRMEYDAARLGRKFEDHEKLQTPIGGRLMPHDISPMAVYLASDDARMITGQAYNICGGLVMS